MATKGPSNKTATSKAAADAVTTPVKAKVLAASPQREAPDSESLTHRLDALLHTMRCIAQHEDQLCSLLHDARRSGRISAAVRRELQAILSELPAEEYTDDLHAVVEIASAA